MRRNPEIIRKATRLGAAALLLVSFSGCGETVTPTPTTEYHPPITLAPTLLATLTQTLELANTEKPTLAFTTTPTNTPTATPTESAIPLPPAPGIIELPPPPGDEISVPDIPPEMRGSN